MLFVVNLDIIVEGEENLNDEGGVILFNHTSLFDIPVMLVSIKKSFRFGAKTELFKIPVFGTAMKNLETLQITRGDREKVLKLYENSVHKLHDGLSFALAPEGGRRTSDSIEPFKSGPFIFAIHAQAQLTPVILIGVKDILPKKKMFPMWGVWKRQVRVKILPPIQSTGCTQNDRKILQEKAYKLMKTTFDEASKS